MPGSKQEQINRTGKLRTRKGKARKQGKVQKGQEKDRKSQCRRVGIPVSKEIGTR
jgi:hypothetical protein